MALKYGITTNAERDSVVKGRENEEKGRRGKGRISWRDLHSSQAVNHIRS